MSEDGYTAADALAALAILGLAIGGVVAGVEAVGQGQRSAGSLTAEAVALRTAEGELTRLVVEKGPFRSDAAVGFQGDAQGFSFPCEARRCGARLQDGKLHVEPATGASIAAPLPKGEGLKFDYVGSLGVTPRWPPNPPSPASPAQVLQSIVLTDGKARPLAMARVWAEQPFDCEFDGVIQDCRSNAP